MGLQFLILVMRVVYSKQQAIDLRISVRVIKRGKGRRGREWPRKGRKGEGEEKGERKIE